MERIHQYWVSAVLITLLAGCTSNGAQWVIGEQPGLTSRDRSDCAAATAVAERYLSAWVREDYHGMYAIESRHTTKTYEKYCGTARWWRTAGFSHARRSSFRTVDLVPEHIEVVTGLSGSQAQILLSVLAVDASTVDEVKRTAWPDRVALLRVRIAGKPCALFMGKEDGRWHVLNQPGMLEDAIPSFWESVRGKKHDGG